MTLPLALCTGLCLLAFSGATAMAAGKSEATWVVDPALPGENLPPVGRSQFDRLFASERAGKVDYDLPFPFEALLGRIDSQLSGDPSSPLPPAKRVLIPLGRSLQRTAAAPDYFAFPRVVVAVDSPPASPSNLLLKDRLYIGYQEKSAVLEVISYNETVGRFEFQLVKDYRAGGEPQVVYANRTLCYACHQNGAPIFSRALWDETNANPQVAALLAASGKSFYGVPPERGVDVPYAIDIAIKRSNGFALTQRLWQEGCGDADLSGRRCRAGLFTAALRHVLADGRKAAVAALLPAEIARRWPGGLATAPADIPNRNPLQGLTSWPDDAARQVAYSHVPARFEPLAPRQPQAIWRADATDAMDQLVNGLAEFVAASDRQRLENALAARPAQVVRHEVPCRFETRASRWSVRCQPAAGETGPQLTATLEITRGKVSGGRLERLALPGGDTLSSVALIGTAPRSNEQFSLVPEATSRQSQIRPSHRRKRPQEVQSPVSSSTVVLDSGFRRNDDSPTNRPRGADGNPLTRIAFQVSSNDPTDGRVTVDFRQEFSGVEKAVMDMAEGPDGAALFGARPFPREQLFAALLSRLDAPVVAACCQAADKLPPPHLEVPAIAPGSSATMPMEKALQGFYPYCATCHQSAETFPPNFLSGNATQVAAQLRQCAPRLYVRLAMADLTPEQRDKTPMPPESLLPAFATTSAGWRTSPARAALFAQVSDWLKAETGQPPNLSQLLAGGYEALRPCLPTNDSVMHPPRREAP